MYEAVAKNLMPHCWGPHCLPPVSLAAAARGPLTEARANIRKSILSMAVNGTDTQIDSLVARHFADLVAGAV